MKTVDFSLEGKIALLTGGSRGIGEAIATEFALRGAHCILTGRKLDGLNEAVDRITASGGSAEAVACHAGELSQIARLVQSVAERHGRVDILVNNAATNPHAGTVLGATEAAWDKTFDVNVKGAFFLTQQVVPLMKAGGSVINIASIEGVRPGLDRAMYSISKAAVISMTKAFAKELANLNIRVNAILPGLVDTRMAHVLFQDAVAYDKVVQNVPMRRHARPDELTGAALYFASNASSYATGAILAVDGGVLA